MLTYDRSVNQVVGTTKRGTLTAFAGGFAQLGGIIASVAFPKSDGPRYVPGISTCIVFSFSGILAAIVMWVCCGIENRARETGKRDHLRQLSEDEQEQLGEKHPDFRYTL
jgi:sugar phosphate permease